MATYAIGDLQACLDECQALLERLNFKPDTDRLWLTGDLVGRGPKPLETLRFVRSLGEAAIIVLGNHDLHLLAQAEGLVPDNKQDPTLSPILEAEDRDSLLSWLRQQPLLHVDQTLGYGLVHAGLPPQWDVATAQACAKEVEAALTGSDYQHFLASMYGDEPSLWQPDLTGDARLRYISNCLTRMRYCHPDGRLDLQHKGSPFQHAEHNLRPWFAVENRQNTELDWVFGHWSTLGQVHWAPQGAYGLDSGCLWGGALTALCLETGEITQLPCSGYRKPR